MDRRSRASAGFTREAIGDALIDSAADAVVASDAEGAIVLWNPGAERIFGFTEEEALGSSLDIIIPEPFRARHWEGYRETVASGQSRYGAGDMLSVPGLTQDGRRISLEFTIALLRDEAGKVSGMVAVLRDITPRFEEMKALKKKMAATQNSPGA
nr:PAS domain-containing protein [Ancylobacter aquaticus]